MQPYKERIELIEIFKQRKAYLSTNEAKNEIIGRLQNHFLMSRIPPKLINIVVEAGIKAMITEYDSFIIPGLENY